MCKRLCLAMCVLSIGASCGLAAEPVFDPAAWGSDHVGQPRSEFMSGDECLFCHRNDVGPTWSANRHGQTIRTADHDSPPLKLMTKSPALADFATQIELVLGRSHRQRFLKRGSEHGKLDLLSAQWIPPKPHQEGHWTADRPTWNATAFGKNCAGCHATAVDAKTRAFAALSLDCFVCHGQIPEKHTTEPALAHFSKRRKEEPRVVASTCGQCHLRTGTSKSTGLPFPNNFVAGDNLFRDFQVDLSEQQIRSLNPADAHIAWNVRDVAIANRLDVTCLSCHSVHQSSSSKHHRVTEGQICAFCHRPGTKKERIPYEVHSARCGY